MTDEDRTAQGQQPSLVIPRRNRRKLSIDGKTIDGRSILARHYETVADDLARDVGGEPSAAQWQLIDRAAGLSVLLGQLEARVVLGETIDTGEYSTLINTQNRVLAALGLGRRAKDVTPKQGAIVDSHARAVREAQDDC